MDRNMFNLIDSACNGFLICGVRKVAAVILLVTIVFGTTGLAGCGNQGDAQDVSKQESVGAKLVRVTRLDPAPANRIVEVVGELSSHRKVAVASELGGVIERLCFEKGDRVKAGAILAEIATSSIELEVRQAEAALLAAESRLRRVQTGSRPEEIRAAEAVLEEAEATLKEARQHYERIENLHRSESVSRSEYDAARSRLDAAQARRKTAFEQLVLARKGPREEDREMAMAEVQQARAALSLARDRLDKSRIQAPSDGIAAFRELEKGEVVPPGTVITRIVDLSRLKIRLSVSEKDLPALDERDLFAFTVDALPDETFRCRRFFVSPTADPATRSFPVEMTVEETDPRMADGMTARVRLPLADPKRGFKVPSAWLSEEEGKLGLYVVEERKAVFKKVELGEYYDQRVEILSGIESDELVITTPAGLTTGDPVAY